ncbi:M20/M25/M40 family metallo-hydrolase [Lutibacter sp.]|uniref:M20/M25/M40 family metallo-hydrolase n=1 Tax=Lutibacter sp. TaxID=1925666 RepID=UPI0035658DFE
MKFNAVFSYLLLFVFIFLVISCNSSRKFTEDQIPMLKTDISTLSADEMEGRLVGSKGEKLASNYISERFKNLGIKGINDSNSYLQIFEVKPKVNPHSMVKDTATIIGHNVVGFLDNKAKKTVIIGAHYDHLGYGEMGGSLLPNTEKQIHNGADDNASGVAAMLAIAERLKVKKLKTYNYLFLAFSGEEEGLWGSNYYSKNPTIDFDNVAFMINMDMVGRLDEEKRIAIHGTGTAPVWDVLIDSILVSDFKIKKHISGIGPSDHTSFYLQDVSVLHFFTGQHEDYHKPTDDADLINYVGLELIVDYIEELLTIMNEKPAPVFTKTKDDSTETPAFKVTLGVIPDYLYNETGMRIDGVNDGRPAHRAGLIKGDIVKKMGDFEIIDMMSYMQALSKFEKGQTIKIAIERNGKIIEKELTF